MRAQTHASAAERRAAILEAIRKLPRGAVVSYGEVAARAGLPGLARLAARVLSELPRGSRLPWHRVLRSDGRIAFPPRSGPAREQLQRLRAEGVTFVRGRVSRDPKAALDASLWGPAPVPGSRSNKVRRGVAS